MSSCVALCMTPHSLNSTMECWEKQYLSFLKTLFLSQKSSWQLSITFLLAVEKCVLAAVVASALGIGGGNERQRLQNRNPHQILQCWVYVPL